MTLSDQFLRPFLFCDCYEKKKIYKKSDLKFSIWKPGEFDLKPSEEMDKKR